MRKSLPVLNANASNDAHEHNHQSDDPNPIDLPEIQRATLDWDSFACVLADLDDFAEVVETQARHANGNVEKIEDMEEAHATFESGKIVGLQIVYEFADQRWCDTFLRNDEGAEIARMLDPMRVS